MRSPITSRRAVIAQKQKRIEENPKDGYAIWMCLAKTKQEYEDGHKFCRRMARKETLRCRIHGGKSKGRPPVHGRYSKFFDAEFEARYTDMLEDEKLLDLSSEIAVLRTLFVELKRQTGDLISAWQDEDGKIEINKAGISALQSVIRDISSTVEKMHKIEAGYFSPEILPIIINQIVSISGEVISSCPHCGKDLSMLGREVFTRLKQLSVPSNKNKELMVELPHVKGKGRGSFLKNMSEERKRLKGDKNA